ncbi:MAG TPA: hypothetical protein VGB92_02875 [Longimicrobium sp.]|jgi:hypothetical protein
MHVYLRDEPVELELREVDHEGLLPEEAELIPVAFYADGNDRPSFRALLPPETLAILEEALQTPVQLGLLAEEPEEATAEIHAMVGLSIPVDQLPEGISTDGEEEEHEHELEPWQSAPAADAWRGEGAEPEEAPRTVMLAFAPLVRLARRFPDDFGEELADLLESALSGATKPSLEARVDRMLGGP